MPNSILVVDDDPTLRILAKLILERAGFISYEAADGLKALEFLNTTVPDLFIVDVMMPRMDGYELCEELRRRPETAQHPIIMLSARPDSESRTRGLASGADVYLVKPVEHSELVAHIEKCLEGKNPL